MVGPLLDTKTHVPGRQPGALVRPRLAERLGRGTRSALTLVSAPAGFGKTTLLTAVAGRRAGARRRAVAWLSLDEARRRADPVLDLRRHRAAGTAVDGVGAGALAAAAGVARRRPRRR